MFDRLIRFVDLVAVAKNTEIVRISFLPWKLWWKEMGTHRFPRARKLMITADGGGSNSSDSRLWKVERQHLANELGMRLHVCHFPPGTST